jgi:PPP family 3-phenylpropionic acid transporter
LTRDFTTMLLIAAVYGMFYAPIISFLEAFAMDALGERKRRYGALRAWGSASFILVVLALGRLLDSLSVEIVVPLILAGSLVHTLVAFRLPPGGGTSAPRFVFWESGLLSMRTGVFLASGILMLFSHGTYYGFFSIHLENLGMDRLFIGLCWAVAVVTEIAVMVNSQRLFDRFSLRTVIAASFAAAAGRWLILGFTRHPVIILVTQPLHAASYGTFHMACILYMDRLAAGSSKTLGQAVNNALTYGLGLMAGFLVNGALYDTWTAFGLFRLSAAAALLGGVVFTAFSDRRRP